MTGMWWEGRTSGHWYNTVMLGASLVQTTVNLFPPALLAALVAVVLVSLLALLVSLRIARRMGAIGEQGQTIADDESTVNPRPAKTDR